MKLIREEIQDVKFLVEDNKGKKDYFIEGIFLQGNKPNKNGRIYPVEILQKEVDRYIKECINAGRALGELNHPESAGINLDKVSHQIKEIKQTGDDFYGKAKVLDTPCGKIVKTFLEEGIVLGVSSRGLGNLINKNGYDVVQDDFYLSTVDIVADPSAPDAFVNGILEGKEWVMCNGVFKEKQIAAAKSRIHSSNSKQAEAIALKLFEDFFKKLKLSK